MYYVVYLIGIQRNIVVPIKWVRNGEEYLERYVDKSLNTTHTHLCFWRADAVENGKPNPNYVPNFSATIQHEFPCDEGVYQCSIVKFKSEYRIIQMICVMSVLLWLTSLLFFTENYEDALSYSEKIRKRAPAVYNQNRLLEVPIPNLMQNNDNIRANIVSNDLIGADLNPTVRLEHILVNFAAPNDHIDGENSSGSNIQQEQVNRPIDCIDDDMDAAGHSHNQEEVAVNQDDPFDYLNVDNDDMLFNPFQMDGTDQNDGSTENAIGNSHDRDALESNTVLKYEITVDDTDYGEIANILGGTRTNVFAESSGHQSMRKKKKSNRAESAVRTASGYWNVETIFAGTSDVMTSDTMSQRNSCTPRFDMKIESNDSNDTLITSVGLETASASDCAGVKSSTDAEKEVEMSSSKNSSSQLECTDEDSDDVQFLEPDGEWPKPLNFTLEGYIKRKDDRFSGDLKFGQDVNVFFIMFSIYLSNYPCAYIPYLLNY